MNYIQHINAFYTRVKNDAQLTSSHVSLYMAMFHYWYFIRFRNPFPIKRETMMQMSKIGSKNTYHKCIRDLHLARYIYYHEPLTKFQPVKISIIRLDKKEAPEQSNQLHFFTPSENQSLNPNPIIPTELTPSPLGGNQAQRRLGAKLEGWGPGGGRGGPGSPSPKNGTPASPKIDTASVPILTDSCHKNDTDSVPDLTIPCPKNETGTVPKMGHLIKDIYILIV